MVFLNKTIIKLEIINIHKIMLTQICTEDRLLGESIACFRFQTSKPPEQFN